MTRALVKIRKSVTSIPEEVWDREGLTGLDLVGDGIKELPDDVGRLSTLKYFSITSKTLEKVSSKLFELPNITSIKIKGGVFRNLPIVDSPTKSLSTFIVSYGKLEEVPLWIKNFLRLDTFDVAGNSLVNLPEEMELLKNITRFNIEKNSFETMPRTAEKLPKLNHLSVDGNKFSKQELEYIGKTFSIWF